jgi:hypothetical protein
MRKIKYITEDEPGTYKTRLKINLRKAGESYDETDIRPGVYKLLLDEPMLGETPDDYFAVYYVNKLLQENGKLILAKKDALNLKKYFALQFLNDLLLANNEHTLTNEEIENLFPTSTITSLYETEEESMNKIKELQELSGFEVEKIIKSYPSLEAMAIDYSAEAGIGLEVINDCCKIVSDVVEQIKENK